MPRRPYTAPVKDWPALTWSHRRSANALTTRVTLNIESQTADTITTVLYIGHQAPNLTQVRHTFRRQGSAWTPLRRGRKARRSGIELNSSVPLRGLCG